jgi:hypothetical protein
MLLDSQIVWNLLLLLTCYKLLVLLLRCQREYDLYNLGVVDFTVSLGPNKFFVLITLPRKVEVCSLKGTKFNLYVSIWSYLVQYYGLFYLLDSLKVRKGLFRYFCISSSLFAFKCFCLMLFANDLFILKEKLFSFKDLYTFVSFTWFYCNSCLCRNT